jgi:collagenase-like PrtC family protease
MSNSKFKIHAPVVMPADVDRLIDAGADSFYIGFTRDTGLRGDNLLLHNRRPMTHANVRHEEDFHQIIELAHRRDTLVSLCLNYFYDDRQLDNVLEQVEFAVSAGIDRLIVGDVGLIAYLHSHYPDLGLTLSTVGTAMNVSDVSFYQQLGISSITLVRQLLLDEVDEIVKQSQAASDFIVFIYGSKCPNLDGYCSFQHGIFEQKGSILFSIINNKAVRKLSDIIPVPEALAIRMKKNYVRTDLGCSLPYKSIPLTTNDASSNIPLPDWSFEHNLECGLCAIRRFAAAGITTYKIVGREHPLNKRVSRTKMTRTVLDFYSENPNISDKEFYDFCRKLTRRELNWTCAKGDCYYPEVFA